MDWSSYNISLVTEKHNKDYVFLIILFTSSMSAVWYRPTYEGCLKGLWTHLITLSWNFVEVW